MATLQKCSECAFSTSVSVCVCVCLFVAAQNWIVTHFLITHIWSIINVRSSRKKKPSKAIVVATGKWMVNDWLYCLYTIIINWISTLYNYVCVWVSALLQERVSGLIDNDDRHQDIFFARFFSPVIVLYDDFNDYDEILLSHPSWYEQEQWL